jgi:predicted DsbA family dithiol-disulfide isomerase
MPKFIEYDPFCPECHNGIEELKEKIRKAESESNNK